MAIYPYHSTTIINKDVLPGSTFKAGMALVIDTNGRAIKADSQQLVFNNIYQKYGRFLGFSASDHDISGNTIIIPDNVGNNHLDINNRFIKNENTEYAVPKRGLLDLQDSAVSNFYNASDPNTISKRGIGVYNTPGDYFVTDQFNPVLHGDYGVDSVGIETINPGDLLTFGGGINAGKLVKVNTNSFGPDVLVVGQVSRYITSTGLLYFRQVNYNLSFGTNNIQMIVDASQSLSYQGFGTNWNDVSGTNLVFSMNNGPIYTNAGSQSYFYFDGSDDFGYTNYSATYTAATFAAWIYPDGLQDGFDAILFDRGSATGLAYYNSNQYVAGSWNNDGGESFIPGSLLAIPINRWNFIAFTVISTGRKYYLNDSASAFHTIASPTHGFGNLNIARDPSPGRYFKGRISQIFLMNRALSDTELLNYYNATKSRYGL